MGSLTRDQLDTITILYQHSTKESFIEKLYQDFQNSTQFKLHAWRKKDYSLWNSSLPDGACGWYTVVNIHRRAHSLPPIDFQDQAGCLSGVSILNEVVRISKVDSELATKFHSTCRWLTTERLTPFRAQDQLTSIDFASLSGDIRMALFMTPPYVDSPRMHSTDWIQLYHHTASPPGSATPTFGDLLKLARDSNYVQLVDHHFWPLPVPQQEHLQLQQALTDLVSNIWNFLATLNYQSLLLTSHQANTIIEVDQDDLSRGNGNGSSWTQPHTGHSNLKCDSSSLSGDSYHTNSGPSVGKL